MNAEQISQFIIYSVLVETEERIKNHYFIVIRNFINDCKKGTWEQGTWRTKDWIATHTIEERFVDRANQFMAIQPMAYPYPDYLEDRLISAVIDAGRREIHVL